MVRALVALSLLGVVSAGCVVNAPTQPSASPAVVKKNETKATREFTIQARGPISLATAGTITSGDVSGVISTGGGNVISTGGGNVISTGGGNFSAPTFRLQATSTESFANVANAGVVLEALDGKRLATTFKTDASGKATLKGIPADKAYSAVALFTVNYKTYRLAVAIPNAESGDLMADPINTFVEARVRELLLQSGKGSALSLAKLNDVWDVFNTAAITVEPTDLEIGKPLEALTAVYTRAIAELETREKAGDTTAAAGIKTIKEYMATLK